MYLLKLALRPWRMALLSQLFSAIAVGFLLLLIGFLFWMQQGLKSVLIRLQGEQVVIAYIDRTIEQKDETKILENIRAALGFRGYSEVKLVNANQFIGSLKNQYPDLVRELEDLGQDMNQIVPRYISVSGMLPASALEKIKSVHGIESAESSKDRYHHIVSAFSTLHWVVRILMGGVFFALLTGLMHLSKMNSYLHHDALGLLHFWGAGPGTLMGPGLLSGMFVGLLGGFIACGGWMSVGVWLAQHVRSLSSMLRGMPPVHSGLAVILLCIGASMGVLAGLLGNFPSYSPTIHDGSLKS